MTDPELFKYDVRVRERMLRKGLINEAEVDKRLQALADLEGQCVEFELKQPALHRQEQDAPAAPRPAPQSPPSPAFAEAPRRIEPELDDGEIDDEDEDEDDELDDDLDESEAPAASGEDGAAENQPPPEEGWEKET